MTDRIEIVSHCWCGPKVPIYADLLRMQINSLLTFPPQAETVLRVVCSVEDQQTKQVLNEAHAYLRDHADLDGRVRINPIYRPLSYIFRRAVVRNYAALSASPDTVAVWFADCDYLFGPGCLDETCRLSKLHPEALICPKSTLATINHEAGDLLRSEQDPLGKLVIDQSDFLPKRNRRAIGGVQIVSGVMARDKGYLNNTHWSRPASGLSGLTETPEDVAFRKRIDVQLKLDIPNCYRIRHTHSAVSGTAQGS